MLANIIMQHVQHAAGSLLTGMLSCCVVLHMRLPLPLSSRFQADIAFDGEELARRALDRCGRVRLFKVGMYDYVPGSSSRRRRQADLLGCAAQQHDGLSRS